MTVGDRKALLALARSSVESAAKRLPPPEIPDGEIFRLQGGAFVTLKAGGVLRGCIGHFTGLGTLGETVRAMAREAAVGDPRFMPVAPEETVSLSIEISVLSPMEPVDPSDVKPGVHGLYVRMGHRAGTLLPQVASEYGWGREEFLSHTCMKAGLAPDAWRDPAARLFSYTAEVFSENDIKDGLKKMKKEEK